MKDFDGGVIVVVVVTGGKQSQLLSFDFDWDWEFDKSFQLSKIISMSADIGRFVEKRNYNKHLGDLHILCFSCTDHDYDAVNTQTAMLVRQNILNILE